MSEHDHRKTIAEFWRARQAGDNAAVHSLLAKNATYEMAGAESLAGQVPAGRVDAKAAADQFIAAFPFHDVEPLMTLVDGRKAAGVTRVTVSHGGGRQVTSEIGDVWEFDGEGKIASLKQFVDTDLIRRMLAGQV